MNKKKFLTTLSIAAVAIISGYGGMKSYQSHASDYDELFSQNVEALSRGDKDPVEGGLITCVGPDIYAFPRILSGKFSCYEHTNKTKIKEDSTVVYYDDENEVNYEICVASGTGNYPGTNYFYRFTEEKTGEAECTNLCSNNRDAIISEIIYSTYQR